MLTKYADLEVIEVRQSDRRLAGTKPGQKFSSFDHLPEDTYRTDDGYMYIKVRAISSRVNKNWDGWPVQELAGMKESKFRQLASESEQKTSRVLTANLVETRGDYGFKTFAGRPFFVDHNNSDPKRTRGVIVDSLLHIESPKHKRSKDDYWADAPENHTPETWIELLIELDAEQFPKLANAFKTGEIDSVSMGCNVEETECSVCGNRAQTMDDYCVHIKNKGGIYESHRTAGKKVHAYEDCYGINFFEISAVFDPADETALTTDTPRYAKTASKWQKVAGYGTMGTQYGSWEELKSELDEQHDQGKIDDYTYQSLVSQLWDMAREEGVEDLMANKDAVERRMEERGFDPNNDLSYKEDRNRVIGDGVNLYSPWNDAERDIQVEYENRYKRREDKLKKYPIQPWSKIATQMIRANELRRGDIIAIAGGRTAEVINTSKQVNNRMKIIVSAGGTQVSYDMAPDAVFQLVERNNSMEENYDRSLSFDDHDFLMDNNIRWSKTAADWQKGQYDPPISLEAVRVVGNYVKTNMPNQVEFAKNLIQKFYMRELTPDQQDYLRRIFIEAAETTNNPQLRQELLNVFPESDNNWLADNGMRWSKVANDNIAMLRQMIEEVRASDMDEKKKKMILMSLREQLARCEVPDRWSKVATDFQPLPHEADEELLLRIKAMIDLYFQEKDTSDDGMIHGSKWEKVAYYIDKPDYHAALVWTGDMKLYFAPYDQDIDRGPGRLFAYPEIELNEDFHDYDKRVNQYYERVDTFDRSQEPEMGEYWGHEGVADLIASENGLSEEERYKVYGQSFRGVYNPAIGHLVHMSEPRNPIGGPQLSGDESAEELWRLAWREAAMKAGVVVNEFSITRSAMSGTIRETLTREQLTQIGGWPDYDSPSYEMKVPRRRRKASWQKLKTPWIKTAYYEKDFHACLLWSRNSKFYFAPYDESEYGINRVYTPEGAKDLIGTQPGWDKWDEQSRWNDRRENLEEQLYKEDPSWEDYWGHEGVAEFISKTDAKGLGSGAIYGQSFRGIYNPATGELVHFSMPYNDVSPGNRYNSAQRERNFNENDPRSVWPFWQEACKKDGIIVTKFRTRYDDYTILEGKELNYPDFNDPKKFEWQPVKAASWSRLPLVGLR